MRLRIIGFIRCTVSSLAEMIRGGPQPRFETVAVRLDGREPLDCVGITLDGNLIHELSAGDISQDEARVRLRVRSAAVSRCFVHALANGFRWYGS